MPEASSGGTRTGGFPCTAEIYMTVPTSVCSAVPALAGAAPEAMGAAPTPPVAMGTDAGAVHAGLKENARVKPYHSAAPWPISARGGGGGDQWLAACAEGAGLEGRF